MVSGNKINFQFVWEFSCEKWQPAMKMAKLIYGDRTLIFKKAEDLGKPGGKASAYGFSSPQPIPHCDFLIFGFYCGEFSPLYTKRDNGGDVIEFAQGESGKTWRYAMAYASWAKPALVCVWKTRISSIRRRTAAVGWLKQRKTCITMVTFSVGTSIWRQALGAEILKIAGVSTYMPVSPVAFKGTSSIFSQRYVGIHPPETANTGYRRLFDGWPNGAWRLLDVQGDLDQEAPDEPPCTQRLGTLSANICRQRLAMAATGVDRERR